MTLKEKIKEYVDDHYKYYAFYPYDVEVDAVSYTHLTLPTTPYV